MSSPAVTRSKKPSASERTPSSLPQPRKPRSRTLTTPSIMEVPATPTVLSTPALPPTNPLVVPSIQNTVSPVRFHTPNASPPNPPDKDDDDDEDSDSEEDKNEKKAPAAGGGNANHANSGNPGGDPDDSDNNPHDGNNSQGSDSENESENNVEVVDEVFSPSIQNQLANHLVRLSDKIDSINDDSSFTSGTKRDTEGLNRFQRTSVPQRSSHCNVSYA